jgi:predicted transcriptional regulator YheO
MGLKMSRPNTKIKHDVLANQTGPLRENREEPPMMTQNDLLFRTLKQIADALAAIFPRAFEVVVLDLSHPRESIKHIAGDITRRTSRGPVTDLVGHGFAQKTRACQRY